jgi:hypothetical protein
MTRTPPSPRSAPTPTGDDRNRHESTLHERRPAFRDPPSPAARVADLVGRMTVAEKVGQMMQWDARDDLADHVLRASCGVDPAHLSGEGSCAANRLTAQTRGGSR